MGKPEAGVIANVYNGRDLPTLHKIIHPFEPQVLEIGQRITRGRGRQTWAASREYPEVDVSAELSVIHCTSDPGGLGRARKLASKNQDRKNLFLRPSVGFYYRSRTSGQVHRLDGAADDVGGKRHFQVNQKTMGAADFWMEYVPFDACFSHELVPFDVVVMIATHETTPGDLARAYDLARVALVVVGTTVETLRESLEATL